MAGANECPIDGCERGRGDKQLMCRTHWRKVPKDQQAKIYRLARRMWAVDGVGKEYQDWSEARDETIAAVELAEAPA